MRPELIQEDKRFFRNVALSLLAVILIAMSLLYCSSCQLVTEGLPINFNVDEPDDPVVIPPDTTLVEPIILDTCEVLIHYTDPSFTMLSTYFFNGAPAFHEWGILGNNTTWLNILDMLEFYYPQYQYTYYEGNNGVSVIVDGISNPSFLQGKVWSRDAAGIKQLLTSCERCLYFYGSATPEQAIAEASNRASIRSFHLLNTDNWTPIQQTTFARKCGHFPICKHGEHWASFRESDVPQTLIDSFDLFLWANTVQ